MMHKSVVGKMSVWTLFLVLSGMFVLFSQEVRLQIFRRQWRVNKACY